jgi:polygalacturonase
MIGGEVGFATGWLTRRGLLQALGGFAQGQVAEIVKRIVPPRFPPRDFAITAYGARAGETVDATGAIRRAIAACVSAGGGRVVIPAGVFLTGAIHLRSSVNLHLEPGSTLRFRREPSAYVPAVFTRWEGMECMNYSPFVYAFGQENIAITGAECRRASRRQSWWPWKGARNAAGSPGAEPGGGPGSAVGCANKTSWSRTHLRRGST